METSYHRVRQFNKSIWKELLRSYGIILFLFIVFICMYLFLSFYDYIEILIYLSCIYLVFVFIWSLWTWKVITNSLFDPYILFLITAILFNAGQAFLEVFNLNEFGILQGQFILKTILDTLLLVILSLISFHSGALLCAGRSLKKKYQKENVELPTTQEVRMVGWGLLLVSAIPAFLFLRDSFNNVMSFGYFIIFQKAPTIGFDAIHQNLGAFLVPGTLFLIAGSKRRVSGIMVSLIVILTYSLFRLFLGSRGWAVMPLIAYVWLWHRCINPIPKAAIFVGTGILLFIAFPIIGVVRNIPGEERYFLSFLIETFLSINNPVVSIISELGGSMGTIAHTLELVPDTRPFEMGQGYLYAAYTIIPNLFWDIHPTIARGIASEWLTWTVNPIAAFQGGGLGYSFIAEAYLNFGWFGAPIALGIIGFIFGKLVLWAHKSGDFRKLAMVASFLAFFLFYARGESAHVLRSLIWYSFFPYILTYIFRVKKLTILKNRFVNGLKLKY